MSTYLNNYWSLYSEFINVFKNMKYRNIPIALLTNFYQQINDELRLEMEKEDFSLKLKYSSIHEKREIQPFFDKILRPIRIPIKNQPKGKVVVNSDYTRLPEKTFTDYFRKEKTIIISRSKKPELFGISNEYIGKFKRETNGHSAQLVKTASRILTKYKDHPALGNSYFANTFIKRIPTIVDAIETAVTFYQEVQTSILVIGTTEDVVSRAWAMVGSMYGIPSICLQHGILMGEEAFIPVFSSHVAVYGDYEKQWYMTRGLQENRIEIIGHPRYDHLFTKIQDLKVNGSKSHLNPSKIQLLITTGPNLDASKLTSFIAELNLSERYQILLKPHPWELAKNRTSLYTELQKKYNFLQVITDRKIDTNELIMNSDAVISSLSTVALEAMILNKPVFIYYFIQSNREYDYFNGLGNYVQRDPKELVKMINSYFQEDEERKQYEHMRIKFLESSYSVSNASSELVKSIEKITGGLNNKNKGGGE
ncbi:CDP-glycerol glycerophosphotransferase family protein [Robertmurraya korlensis]|uniref:CDP-glycerol glycerophosphotransferase family protein n=1 Tax=Robertmurraya korlensis TaxID=519977 RepID=UPI00082648EE|nr:CDP-glycerol glycerophosphotransferase family protein [Robertmurraya korlensis]